MLVLPLIAIFLAFTPCNYLKGFRLRNGEVVFETRLYRRGSAVVRVGAVRVPLRKQLAVVYDMEEVRVTRNSMDLRLGTATFRFIGKTRVETKNGAYMENCYLSASTTIRGRAIYGVENAEAVIEELKLQFPRAAFVEE